MQLKLNFEAIKGDAARVFISATGHHTVEISEELLVLYGTCVCTVWRTGHVRM